MKKRNVLKNLWINHEYIFLYAKILLKTRVAGSYLGFLWLYIDPLMFMLTYSFVVMVIFKASIPNFNVFVLIGITIWNLFSRTLLMATTSITRNKSIFQQVYFHKFVYPTIYLISYTYEFFIAMSLIVVMMFVEKIPVTWHMLETIPVLFTLLIFTYGCSLIIAHFGVYLIDLRNILDFTLRFVFYLSPIMWSFDTLKFDLVWLLKLNPIQFILGSFRSCILYGKNPDYLHLGVICILSCVLIQIGYSLIRDRKSVV